MSWQRRLFCDCGFSVHDNGFQDEFFRHYQPCPKCGGSWSKLKPSVVRWDNSKIIWWKPSTWNLGRWEGK